LIISLLITACRKDPLDAIGKDEARMHGKIIEKGSKKPIKGARVYLRNCKCIFLAGCNCQVIDSLTTDDTGRYDFTYKYNGFDGHSFDIFVRVPSKYLQENSPAALAPNTHDVVNYDAEIIPLSWVKVHVKDTKLNMSSTIRIYGLTGITYTFSGYNVDTTFTVEKLGRDTAKISGYYWENLIEKQVNAKIYCIPLDTVSAKLFY
jgi:hypothetical protein